MAKIRLRRVPLMATGFALPLLSGCMIVQPHYSVLDLGKDFSQTGQGSLVWSLLLAGAFAIAAAGGACLMWALLRWRAHRQLDEPSAKGSQELGAQINLVGQ
jgi:hypothetical protein